MIKYCFIVPLHNQLALTQAMYCSLLETLPSGLSMEIIFVDDASTDDTANWLQCIANKDPYVRYLINPSNLGYAKSNNRAVAACVSEFLVFLNNDLVLRPQWFEPMIAALEIGSVKTGIVGNVQYRVIDNAIDHAGVELRFERFSGEFFLDHVKSIPDDNFVKTLAVTGACALVRRRDFEEIGGFDELYLNGGEDIDLCFALQALGKHSVVSTQSQILHHVSATRGRNRARDLANSQRLLKKWPSVFLKEIERQFIQRISADESFQDRGLRRMAIDCQTGQRQITPIAIKAMAQESFLRMASAT